MQEERVREKKRDREKNRDRKEEDREDARNYLRSSWRTWRRSTGTYSYSMYEYFPVVTWLF